MADEMGTGKSLSALALIVGTLESARSCAHEKRAAEHQNARIEQYTPATLVIVPLARELWKTLNRWDLYC